MASDLLDNDINVEEKENSVVLDPAHGEKSFYLRNTANAEVMDELKSQLNVLSPSQEKGYLELENVVSEQFLSEYGKFLNEEQIKYMQANEVIFTTPKLAHEFGEDWEGDIVSLDKDVSEIDGRIYLSYSVGQEKANDLENEDETEINRQFWAGRISVVALSPFAGEPIPEVATKWLITDNQYYTMIDKMETKEALATALPFDQTNAIAGVIIHEKIHGIQDLFLPLPVLEASAIFYERKLAKIKGWTLHIGNNMDKLADLYSEFIDENGNDVHHLLFGTLKDSEKKTALLKLMKQKFSSFEIEKASKAETSAHYSHPEFIYWDSIPVSDLDNIKNTKLLSEEDPLANQNT